MIKKISTLSVLDYEFILICKFHYCGNTCLISGKQYKIFSLNRKVLCINLYIIY